MNRRITMGRIIACCLLFLLVTLPVFAENHLVYYATTEGGDKYYYVPETIAVVADNNIFVGSVRDFSVPQNGVSKRISAILFNPEAKQFKILATKSLDTAGKTLEESKFPQASWQDIPVRSALEVLLGKVIDAPKSNGQTPMQKAGSGSGFFISPNIVVTNYHVINGAKQIEIVYNNEVKVSAVVIGTDPVGDLALLRVAGLEDVVKPLTLGNSMEVKEGTRVYAIGFPLSSVTGTTAKITDGLVSSTTGFNGDLRQFQISAPIQPGNSGGPLLNEKAEVIGVVTAQLGNKFEQTTGILPQNVNFAVKASNVKNLIGNLSLTLNLPESRSKAILSPPDIMEIVKKGLVYITVVK